MKKQWKLAIVFVLKAMVLYAIISLGCEHYNNSIWKKKNQEANLANGYLREHLAKYPQLTKLDRLRAVRDAQKLAEKHTPRPKDKGLSDLVALLVISLMVWFCIHIYSLLDLDQKISLWPFDKIPFVRKWLAADADKDEDD